MTQIIAYLTFNGNCREAMTFYQECLGGELTLQTIGETPLSDQMPDSIKGYILHASLAKDGLALMASDMVPESGLQVGNAISLMLGCSSEAEIRYCYEKLSAGGQVTHPLEDTFYGALMGDFTDKFGHHWILNFDKSQQQS